ncbi:MAG: GPI mannosyltransferase 1 [Candidatus Shapirobacteria bacterium GW2011_GWE1_38_10]|uniref:GPI mannosyltransferase 1 n=1 Tax=Candidatus Shapirobacteria bacterium GW2011_GWE1_38_10 TaxID=1618488 RepID=A0A0G0LDP2_9BACT|nr:MAG: GPI mannosyltransferase 1 [Candidatus Shapirobacteria bacterium GW2011_GWF2_37_20]KKQ50761.1 MAG: GPI mannosyltransferase 1 [Candidatus Shapirobacteria bacterium GW2011_GWE1_38_10]KKQ64512.1 MAG: GPI mannosyltransferase 1 [Candidatus Shapirobacteria bacterium GW2011_GWF1_38_23]HBP51238.1 hypothetical protein [Candidatus Shapirobacteria bacterium]
MTLKKTFVLALLIRLIIAPFFYHPDIKSQHFHFQFLSQGQSNIYQYISENKDHLPYRDTFNYLPLTYLTFGSLQSFQKILMPPGFINWLNDWGGTQYNYPNTPYYLLILKLPYIVLDLLLGYLLYKISNSKKILYLWLFNPFSLYLIYIIQNFDILPVFLTVLSYYWLKSKPSLSFFVFGLAIAFKLYPLILLPFFILFKSKNLIKMTKYSLIAATPTLLSILPFASSQAFWQSFFGSGLTQKIIELKIYILPVFPVIYLIIMLFAFLSKKFDLSYYILLISFLFVSTVNFHPQWILWFLPFIFLLKNVSRPSTYLPLTLIGVLILVYIFLFNDNYLTWGHLIPIDPEFLLISSPHEILKNRFSIDSKLIQNYIKLFIALISVLTIAIYEKKSPNHLS